MKRVFKKGAWLYNTPSELTESQFIEKAGGITRLEDFRRFPYVSLLLDDSFPGLVGHVNGRTIALRMAGRKFQTMEWK